MIDAAEPAIDWSQIQRLFGRLLQHSADKLREVDDSHSQTEVDSLYLRQRRYELVAKLRQDLRGARFLLKQTMSKEDARRFFPQRSRLGNLDAGNLARLGSHPATLQRGQRARPKAASLEGDVINPEALVVAIEAADAGAGSDPCGARAEAEARGVFVRHLADLQQDLGGNYKLDLTGATLTVRIAAAPPQAESSATLMGRLECWYFG